MNNSRLFLSNGNWIGRSELLSSLETVQAHDCDVLYMHTGISFGIPNPELKRVELLEILYDIIKELNLKTLCVPTFTFSFCNGDDYDVKTSKSHMGVFNEYIRSRPEAIRSIDPLMSVALIGQDLDLVENLGKESIGKDSTFDKLSRKNRVKFLFFGVSLGDCFTYMHYLEWLAKVPYRYNRKFTGKITEGTKNWEDTYDLFVRYNNVKPNDASYLYGKMLDDQGYLLSSSCGNGIISCVSESDARPFYLDLLKNDPNFFIQEPFNLENADKNFFAKKMVAL
jgi:aminoglycoside 3-N-acetyltransferase